MMVSVTLKPVTKYCVGSCHDVMQYIFNYIRKYHMKFHNKIFMAWSYICSSFIINHVTIVSSIVAMKWHCARISSSTTNILPIGSYKCYFIYDCVTMWPNTVNGTSRTK